MAGVNVLTMMEGSFPLHQDNTNTLQSDYRYDTNADGWVTPRDILRIVNVLNREPGSVLDAEPTSRIVGDFLRPKDEADNDDTASLAETTLAPV